MSEPEHFADVVRRIFPTLEEIENGRRVAAGDQPSPVAQPLCPHCRAHHRCACGVTA